MTPRMGKRQSSPGAVAANLYQGTRSEYLAHYVFSIFGTATLVPHQEDYGLDLFCTLTRQSGGRAEPYAYYSVQVKSTIDDWIFDGKGSVKWILEYPAPLLFCHVDKKSAQVTVYQLTTRFQAALSPDLPERLKLVPGKVGKTDGTHKPPLSWVHDAHDGTLQMGPPILQFTIADLLDDQKYETIRTVLDYWILNDLRNILRQQMAMRSAAGPTSYETNVNPSESGFGNFLELATSLDIPDRAKWTAAEHLTWLGNMMLLKGDQVGALVAALMVRHLVGEVDGIRDLGFYPVFFYIQVSAIAQQGFSRLCRQQQGRSTRRYPCQAESADKITDSKPDT
jgi:hypothetical protein